MSAYARTDAGLVRGHNEDAFLVAHSDESGFRYGTGRSGLGILERKPFLDPALFIACDGMGGANAGEVASRHACDHVFGAFNSPLRSALAVRPSLMDAVRYAISRADRLVHSEGLSNREWKGMGTTCTVAAVEETADGRLRCVFGQVGDSRAWVKRGASLAQWTKDQTLLEQLIENGQLARENAAAFEGKHIVLQALGSSERPVTIVLTETELRPGDMLVLTSDGAHGEEKAFVKAALAGRSPKEVVDGVVKAALDAGGQDNITCVAALFEETR